MAKSKNTLKGRQTTFIHSNAYTKKGFGIKNCQSAMYIIHGKLCFFFTLDGKFKNIEDSEGVTYQTRHPYELVHQGASQDTIASVFTREKPYGPFEYRGDTKKIIRKSRDCNKLLW